MTVIMNMQDLTASANRGNQNDNKKIPKGIRLRRHFLSPRVQNMLRSLKIRAQEVKRNLFGRAKTGGLRQVTMKKQSKKKKQ